MLQYITVSDHLKFQGNSIYDNESMNPASFATFSALKMKEYMQILINLCQLFQINS